MAREVPLAMRTEPRQKTERQRRQHQGFDGQTGDRTYAATGKFFARL